MQRCSRRQVCYFRLARRLTRGVRATMSAPRPGCVNGGEVEVEVVVVEEDAFSGFLARHAAALQSSGIPQIYWKSLFHKLVHEVYDAGQVFGIMRVVQDSEDTDAEEEKQPSPNEVACKVIVTLESGLQASDPTSVFLVDHAWTYRVENARSQLEQIPGLLPRMASLMGVDFHGEAPDPDTVELVLERMWKYNQTYRLSLGSAEERVPVWYILDEFGSRVQHSEQPSCGVAPFIFLPEQISYSVLWPLHDLQQGDDVTRDYTYGETNPLVRQCRLLPWIPADLEGVDTPAAEPSDLYYETIWQENKEKYPVEIQPYTVPAEKILKVYSDMKQVRENLTHPRFQLMEEEDEADVIWSFNHIKDYRKLSEERPCTIVNQFPCEAIITVKDCLAAVARRTRSGRAAEWLPETFNLQTELPQFVRRYQQLREKGEDNHWICKPWNLARGLDTHITNNLDYIIRQRESIPKVVCKYLEDAVLFHREEVGMVKFDVRYMLMLRSVQPLRVYAYNVFWLRFANKPFSLDHFDDYQKHFTVMNYAEDVELKQVHYDEFIPMFEKQYPQYPWREVEGKLFQAFAELFQAATSRPAPYGICAYPSSRAIYAVDLMLKWGTGPSGERVMEPQILEANFGPDCGRACRYHPDFFNHMFQTLILDQPQDCPVTRVL